MSLFPVIAFSQRIGVFNGQINLPLNLFENLVSEFFVALPVVADCNLYYLFDLVFIFCLELFKMLAKEVLNTIKVIWVIDTDHTCKEDLGKYTFVKNLLRLSFL